MVDDEVTNELIRTLENLFITYGVQITSIKASYLDISTLDEKEIRIKSIDYKVVKEVYGV